MAKLNTITSSPTPSPVKRVTPPLGAYGKYVLKTPWVTNDTTNYRCVSLRRVEEIVKSGKNIFETFYEPVGLSMEVAEADIAVGVVFVGLLATDGSRLYVPDTFIISYPDQTAVVHDYTVLTVDLGPQPNDIDLTVVSDEIKNIVNKFAGIPVEVIEVHVGSAQSTTVLTTEEHTNLIDARKLAVENVISTEEQLITLQDKLILSETRNKELMKQLENLRPRP